MEKKCKYSRNLKETFDCEFPDIYHVTKYKILH